MQFASADEKIWEALKGESEWLSLPEWLSNVEGNTGPRSRITRKKKKDFSVKY